MPTLDPATLPDDLPIPEDDGACAHLLGAVIPSINLLGNDAQVHDLAKVCANNTVLFIYPATGRPGEDPGPDWDLIPGAPGCTVQALGFRALHSTFNKEGFQVIGISSQLPWEQAEFSTRQNIPYLLLSDAEFRLEKVLGLPTFCAGENKFYKRVALVVREAQIKYVHYPVFPPNACAKEILRLIPTTSSR